MIKTVRHEEIIQFLQKKQYANVQEICDAVYASPATVRRDLKALEAERLVRLFHGGAMLAHQDEKDVPLSIREYENRKKKIAIAKKAAEMISFGATVMLDASSTAMYVANYLDPAKEMTVFTNCLRTAVSLCERKIHAYCIGGAIKRLSLATTGALAEANVKMLQVDYLFFSSQGLDKNGGITDNSEEETMLRKQMLQHAKQRYFLCDSDKLGKRLLFHVCHAADVDGVVSDADLSEIPGVHWIGA